MKTILKRIIRRIPQIKRIIDQRDSLIAQRDSISKFVPPGHFYSPIPSDGDIQNASLDLQRYPMSAVDLNEDGQVELLKEFDSYYDQIPFTENKIPGLRYHSQNTQYPYGDAVFLYCMIRRFKPKRIVEVGAGYSSCVILDTNELFFDGDIDCSFIDPHPELLMSLLKDEDTPHVRIRSQRLQDIPLESFEQLQTNDILVIDSTHVSKFNSDVNLIIHEILPLLHNGVVIHFHDVFWPFEYPKEWLLEGRAWNEAYVLRSFLEYNSQFEIILFNSFLRVFHPNEIEKWLPRIESQGGGSIWIRKV